MPESYKRLRHNELLITLDDQGYTHDALETPLMNSPLPIKIEYILLLAPMIEIGGCNQHYVLGTPVNH